MGHNLNIDSNGKARMFAAGELPWHKLGTNVKDAVSWSQAMDLAGLNWTVDQRTLFADGDIAIPDYKALTRTELNGKVIPLGIVGKDYEVIQNQTAFDWTEALLNYGAKYESAGALGNGSRIWVLARVEEADYAIGGDKHQSYLLFETSHDGTKAATAKLTDVRVVCQNTLNAALSGNGTNLKIRHTKTAADRFDAARRMIGNTVVTAKELGEKLQKLASKVVSKETYESILNELFPLNEDPGKAAKTRRDNIFLQIAENLKSNDNGAFPEQNGTAYALFNSITNFVDHARATRSNDLVKKGTPEQLRSVSAMFGSGSDLKDRALVTIGKHIDSMEDRPRAVVVPQLPPVAPTMPAPVSTPAEVTSNLTIAGKINDYISSLPTAKLAERDAVAYARSYAIWVLRPSQYADVAEPGLNHLDATRGSEIRTAIHNIIRNS